MSDARYKIGRQAGWIALLAAYIVFSLLDPEWAPNCLFKTATGYDCPACGAVRSASRFVRGEWREAFFLNPYLFVVAPYLLTVSYLSFVRHSGAQRLRGLIYDRKTILFFGCLMVVWWIFRNTPLWLAVAAREIG